MDKEYSVIVFDADGTLRYCTVEGQPCPNSSDEWKLYPGVRETLSRYSWAGPKDGEGTGYGIASNQGGVGVGYFTEEAARDLLEDTFQEAFGFPPARETIQFCPHVPYAGCNCRKPEPLMLDRIMELYRVSSDEVLFVGDREDDRLAAQNAGCHFRWASDFFSRHSE